MKHKILILLFLIFGLNTILFGENLDNNFSKKIENLVLNSSYYEIVDYFSKNKGNLNLNHEFYDEDSIQSEILSYLNFRFLNDSNTTENKKIYDFFIGAGLNINSNFRVIKNKKEHFVSNLMSILSGFKNEKRQIELIDYLMSKGLDIKAPCYFDNERVNLYAPVVVISENLTPKLLEIFAKNKVKPHKALELLANLLVEKKMNTFMQNKDMSGFKHFLKSKNYQLTREKYKEYIQIIFQNYSIEDFDEQELAFIMSVFVGADDTEFIKFVADAGLIKNEKLRTKYLNSAKNNGVSQETIKILEGE
ncbi:hypothetical protein OFO03_04590 [Campylobacter sp. JMF_02 ED1]|uniref:hypothetical protein n=1 Tax=unclassified Campylobacter TaxID=2593542 RepID=UPI0022E9E95B|nr:MULTISPECIES: hypothetical protein [unclassified Campylobacter]MDA3049403.1 hypothetical protein [Campylobacter sp. JMF_15 NE4]MDA3051169.1 hypothetical protein [Campylobacter sp. JMF_02 ED1]